MIPVFTVFIGKSMRFLICRQSVLLALQSVCCADIPEKSSTCFVHHSKPILIQQVTNVDCENSA